MSEKYIKAAHKVQTAIAATPWSKSLQPKHLRTGIDMAKADMKGLAELLISKGVFTLEEYTAALEKSAEEEAELQRLKVAEEMGVDPSKIVLG